MIICVTVVGANLGMGLHVLDVFMEKLVLVSTGNDNGPEFVNTIGARVAIELRLSYHKVLCHSFFVFVGYVESKVSR